MPIEQNSNTIQVTFTHLFRAWVKSDDAKREESFLGLRILVLKRLHAVFGRIALDDCREEHVETYRRLRLGDGARRASISVDLSTLRRIWRWGQKQGMCPEWDLPRLQRSREGAISMAKQAEDAFKYTVNWARENYEKFIDLRMGANELDGYVGRWDRGTATASIAIRPTVLYDTLIAAGYDPRLITKEWQRRCWIVAELTGPITRKIQISVEAGVKSGVQMIVIRHSVIEALGIVLEPRPGSDDVVSDVEVRHFDIETDDNPFGD